MAGMEESTSVVHLEEPSPALLHDAERLFDLGCSAIRSDDYEQAVDLLTKSLEIRVQHYGELGPECARTYHKLGCALLYKVQAEADPLVERNGGHGQQQPQQQQQQQQQAEASSAAGEGSKQAVVEEGESEDDDDEEEGKNPAEVMVADEDMGEEEESDLELAWKMLDIARVIYAKGPERTLEEVDVITSLGDVSLEKELFQLCFADYDAALHALEALVEPDNRRIAELCFKISLAKQLDHKPGEALDYCQRAISVCQRRVERLRGSAGADTGKGKAVPEGELNGHAVEDRGKTVASEGVGGDEGESMGDGGDALKSLTRSSVDQDGKEDEVKEMEELLVDLREKEEELKQMATAPSLLEAFKSSNPEAVAMVTEVYSTTLGLANAAGSAGAGSNAATAGGQVGSSSSTAPVTNLGVMGRGVKRATPIPIVEDQLDAQPKKRNLEDLRNGGGSGETQIGFKNGPS